MLRTKRNWQQILLRRFAQPAAIAGGLIAGFCNSALAQPSAVEALKLTPMQQDVDFDIPDSPADCKIASENLNGNVAWVVRGPSNELLRRFVDSNGDNKVDLWRYYNNGIEVYRDIDADFNGKADQYRWFGTSGTRWGLDLDEDGSIDEWKSISAEEVSAEVVEAIKTADQNRFENLLLTKDELVGLGLGSKLKTRISSRAKRAVSIFKKTANTQTSIDKATKWIDFGGLRPGTIPAGTDGSTKDVTVYENVVAMVETGGKPAQIPIGTLVKVQDVWRVVDLPISNGDDQPPQSVFFEGAGVQSLE